MIRPTEKVTPKATRITPSMGIKEIGRESAGAQDTPSIFYHII
jgi:hypothetical protein